MEKCRIPANSSGYSVDLFTKSKSTILDGGVTNLQATLSKKSTRVTVNWNVGFCDYNYLIIFYILHKGKAFELDLITFDGNLTTELCKFIPGSFTASLSNTIWSITTILEVIDG